MSYISYMPYVSYFDLMTESLPEPVKSPLSLRSA